ncbi:MAG: CHAT domain-containing protein [Chloroflexi bacterium]|nr:CHAT domain-containing protein [Chloroflexota bacterium]
MERAGVPDSAEQIAQLVQNLLDGVISIHDLDHPLKDELAQLLVNELKSEANRHWTIDPRTSLCLAEMIIQIGQARQDTWQVALGTMARGDAFRFLKQTSNAWNDLQNAGYLFLSLHNEAGEIGWARTRIGPLPICAELNHSEEALADAKTAEAIFARHEEKEFLINLHINQGLAYLDLRQCREALSYFESAYNLVAELGAQGENYLGKLYLNFGLVHGLLGNLRQAMSLSEKARAIFTERKEHYLLTQVELNMATIAYSQGRHRQALQLLYPITQHAEPHYATAARDRMVSCYLYLNRLIEARELAQQVVREFEALQLPYNKATALINLATAEGELGNFAATQFAIDQAAQIFNELGIEFWSAIIALWRATIALKQENIEVAQRKADQAVKAFAGTNSVGYINALLRSSQALQKQGLLPEALDTAQQALGLARHSSFVWSRYSVHLLLGQLSEATHQPSRAHRHYQAASATVDRVQRQLSLTLRPDFLQDKNDALRSLIRLDLADQKVGQAFETLERAKAQTFFSYLNSRDTLLWPTDNSASRRLIEEFEQLREKHHWLEQQLQGEVFDGKKTTTGSLSQSDYQELQDEFVVCEKQIRKVREELYLSTGEHSHHARILLPNHRDIQQQLGPDTLLVEYYNDGRNVWVFTLDSHDIKVYPLTVELDEINRQLQYLDFNREFALQVGIGSPHRHTLTTQFQKITAWFYKALLGPLAHQIQSYNRLIVVPYGGLHYLPFHLLYSGSCYLIQQVEVVVLSAASLLTQAPPKRMAEARVLAYPPAGRLPNTIQEAHMVHGLFKGEIYLHGDAQRAVLNTTPVQLLHIAAHGKFRMDHPELALIELADGPLYTDDLLQQDLSYELITLSACETGQVNVVTGDELIGLGRSCLYAGAGALLLTLWRVEDSIALNQMQCFYHMLKEGKSKAAAIREAQCHFMAQAPSEHPAFWGAFQLVGNADALSTLVS